MVFRCQLVNRNLFALNHKIVQEMKQSKSPEDLILFLERDSTYDKCKHAIKVVCQTVQGNTVADEVEAPVQQFTLGYLPTDVSFNLAVLMDENRGYFIISAHFNEH